MQKQTHHFKCRNCGKLGQTTRGAKFCSDSCRVKYHQRVKREQEVFVYRTLRRALEYCIEQHPGLRNEVNSILSSGAVATFSDEKSEKAGV